MMFCEIWAKFELYCNQIFRQIGRTHAILQNKVEEWQKTSHILGNACHLEYKMDILGQSIRFTCARRGKFFIYVVMKREVKGGNRGMSEY